MPSILDDLSEGPSSLSLLIGSTFVPHFHYNLLTRTKARHAWVLRTEVHVQKYREMTEG